MSKETKDFWGRAAAIGFLLAIVLFVVDGLYVQSGVLGILAALCLLPLAVAILGAIAHHLLGFFSEVKK